MEKKECLTDTNEFVHTEGMMVRVVRGKYFGHRSPCLCASVCYLLSYIFINFYTGYKAPLSTATSPGIIPLLHTDIRLMYSKFCLSIIAI